MPRLHQDLNLLKLERVLGLTSNKPMILSVNSVHELVAYAAGCVVILYSHKLNKQVGLLCTSTFKLPPSADGHAASIASGSGSAPASASKGAITSLSSSPRTTASTQWMSNAFASPNINPLAGLAPMAVSDGSVTSSFGSSSPSSNKNAKPKPISCLSFSPDGQFLAIGETGHQPRILILEVASQILVAELQGHKFGVQAVHFSPNSRHLVSLGFQHDGYIHVWNWRTGIQIASNRVTTKVNAIAFSADGSFFVTAGLRHIKYWYLNTGASKRGGLSSTSPNVKVLDGRSAILGDLRHSNYVDAVCSQDGRFTYALTSNGTLCLFTEGRILEKWCDLRVRGAYSINLDDKHIICACTDGNIRLFEPETLEYVGTLPKLAPVGTISGTIHPNNQGLDNSNSVYADVIPEADGERAGALPPDTFVTYSADGSIKFWNLDESISMLPPLLNPTSKESSSSVYKKEILDVLYVDENSRRCIQAPDNQDGMEPGFNIIPLECGIRAVKISSDGRFLASGDKGGNLRVHSLSTFQQLTYQEAHDTEILTIDFTESWKDSPFLVATAGRDRLLHIFDANKDFALVQTLDDHSSSITGIKFTADGSRLMSCGADKSVIFRNFVKTADGMAYQSYHQASGRATFYDMGLDDTSQTLLTVSGDRRFNAFTLDTGKPIKSFKAETKPDDLTSGMAEICSMNHISLDPTGTIAAVSGSDKSVRIYDLLHGTCLAHAICHSELVTSIKFTNNCDRVISTSADGCILIWRLSRDIVRRIITRIQDNVTLPGYLQAKAAEELLTPKAAMATATSGIRPLRLKKSTDRLTGMNSRDDLKTSRPNSAASMRSEDFDLRSGDIESEDLTDQQQKYPGTLKDSRADDISKESFSPVTVRAPGMRSRVKGSISMTPLTRSRQNSLSQQPNISRSQPTPTRPGAQQDSPTPWNRNVIKDKPGTSPSARKSGAAVSPGHQGPKPEAKGQWLKPSQPRPRATSLNVPSQTTLKMESITQTDSPTNRQSLSDYTPEDPPTKAGEDDSTELSDTAASNDHHSVSPVPKNRPEQGLSKLNTKPHARSHTTDDSLISRATEDDLAASDSDVADENFGSDGRDDGDDEDAGVDESVSDTGSDDVTPLSPGQRRNVGPGSLQDLGVDTVDDMGAFQDGERMRDSPRSERGVQVTSPGGRVISMHSGPGRRSLSSRFLIGHAAVVMMGLTHQPLHESPPSVKDFDTTSASEVTRPAALIEQSFDQPPLERLNLQSLNSAAIKWKQQSIDANNGSPVLETSPHIQIPMQAGPTDEVLASPVVVNSPDGVRMELNGMLRSFGQSSGETQSRSNSRTAVAMGQRIDALDAQRSRRSEDNEQSLRDAFDRISFLISHKAMVASRSHGSEEDSESAERLRETKLWMLETREGLLNLVGEVQGHMWALERE
ncbi:hypothetical protein BGZ98_004712 [Dissophora globulifera]|nr:hypothetical protein BGZ98_004712 [Dissophora globulifera]